MEAENLPQYKVSGKDIVIRDGGDIVMKAVGATRVPTVFTEAAPTPTYTYGTIYPHELGVLAPLIQDFYKEIGFKEAADNPEPFIREIYNDLLKNPYSIIYACMDREMKPQGYMWLRIDRNVLQVPFAVIEQDYIIPEHRGTLREARMHHRFIEYAIQVGERCGVQYTNTVVRSKRLEESRAKLGFKSVELRLTFKGTAEDFRKQNPGFQKYGQYNNSSGEV